MANTPAVHAELLDENFDYITGGDIKVSVVRLKDKDDPEKIYLLIQKEMLPDF